MLESTKVSKAAAEFFREQCTGEYGGQEGLVPYNPVILSLVRSHMACGPKDFAQFLRQVADVLENE